MIDIGKRLFFLRDSLDLSQEAIAEKLGVSPPEYDLYEQGKNDFSFSFLYNAANVLGVDVQDLISGDSPKLSRVSVVRKGRGYDITRREAYDYKHLAFTFRNKKAEPFLVTIEPKAEKKEPEKNSHEGQEFCYIVSGSINFFLDGDVYELFEGDSVYFDSALPHAMQAGNNRSAAFLAVVIK